MGCHVMDGAFWALRLAEAKTLTVTAEAAGATDESYPTSATVRYRFGARDQMPPVTLVWYDGGRRPNPRLSAADRLETLGSVDLEEAFLTPDRIGG